MKKSYFINLIIDSFLKEILKIDIFWWICIIICNDVSKYLLIHFIKNEWKDVMIKDLFISEAWCESWI